jgi:guanylate kinase
MKNCGGKLAVLVGQSGSGKTTQMSKLIGEAGFRVSPNVTTRPRRETDLEKEYTYLSDEQYASLRRQGRLLWDAVAGNGAHYSKDICDLIEALTDPDTSYVTALVPDKAEALVRKYGSEVIKPVLLPSPDNAVLLERMTERGDTAHDAAERVANEQNWLAQSLAIEGIHVVTALGIPERHQEILDFVQS